MNAKEPNVSRSLAQELPNYDATGLARAIRTGQLKAVEVVEAHFERIANLNGKVNAIVTLDYARAIARAREADRALARGEVWGLLHGVPFTIKDSFATEGLRTTAGFERMDGVPREDAWVVRRLKEAGAILLGKTNCAALCADIQTSNDIFGTTNNPWDVERTAGGSSGGEGAAVALGMSPLGIGSDSGGSIRIPASYCGVYGLKTSIGTVPRQGLRPLHADDHVRQDSLTTVGYVARSLRDLALCHSVLTGQTFEPGTAHWRPTIKWTDVFDEPLVDDEIAEVLETQISAAIRSGANIRRAPTPIPFGKISPMFLRLNFFEFLTPDRHAVAFYAIRMFELLSSIFGSSYRKLKRQQKEFSESVARFLEDCEGWILPATATAAFKHCKKGEPIDVNHSGTVTRENYHAASMGFTYPLNIAGNPSVVLPIGESAGGLPIAIQVVGKHGADMELLKVASYLSERFMPGKKSLGSVGRSNAKFADVENAQIFSGVRQ